MFKFLYLLYSEEFFYSWHYLCSATGSRGSLHVCVVTVDSSHSSLFSMRSGRAIAARRHLIFSPICIYDFVSLNCVVGNV